MPDFSGDLVPILDRAVTAARCGIRITQACAFLNLPPGAMTTTIESKTNFFRALRKGTARAVATPLHMGRTLMVVDADVRDEDGKRVALVTQTQAVLSST
jgi:uncharacterized protein (TIGR00369 family)